MGSNGLTSLLYFLAFGLFFYWMMKRGGASSRTPWMSGDEKRFRSARSDVPRVGRPPARAPAGHGEPRARLREVGGSAVADRTAYQGEPIRRLGRATQVFRGFPFRAPSYDMVDVDAAVPVVAFDVRRCPVAENFQAQGLSQVCVDAWCNLDVLLAKKWGARLEPTGTPAQGANHCDFRWRVEGRR